MSDLQLTLSELKNRINQIDIKIVELQSHRSHLEYLVSNWKSITALEKEPIQPEPCANDVWECPTCDYSCRKKQGLKQHITHVHPKKEKKIEPPVVCKEDYCGKNLKNNAGLMIHIASAHRETTTLPPKKKKFVLHPKLKTNGQPIEPERIRSEIVNCPNPVCCRLIRFIKGLGFISDGKEFCNMRCHMEWVDAGRPSQFT